MFAALHIPDLPVAAVLSNEPRLRGLPCGVLSGSRSGSGSGKESQGKLPLLAINRAARATGIVPGWELNRALVRCPNLNLVTRSHHAERSMMEDLVIFGESLTPDLELAGSDTVILDLSRVRNPIDETLTKLAFPTSDIWHACADTPDLAHLAATQRKTQGLVVTASDMTDLPLLAVDTISREKIPVAILYSWGLKTLGDFMALPRQSLCERLGSRAVA